MMTHSLLRSPALAGIAALLIFLGTAPRPMRADDGKYLPVTPDSLFGFLPKQMIGWKMTESVAETRHALWLLSTAQRKFEKLPDIEADGNPGPSPTISASVMDTGGCTPYFAIFENFVPGENGTTEKIQIDSYPAIVTRLDAGGTTVKMLVNKRFVVEYRIEHLDLKELKPWLEACDFAGLKKIATPKEISALPPIITMVRVDELNPARNTRYPMHLLSKEDDTAQLAPEAPPSTPNP